VLSTPTSYSRDPGAILGPETGIRFLPVSYDSPRQLTHSQPPALRTTSRTTDPTNKHELTLLSDLYTQTTFKIGCTLSILGRRRPGRHTSESGITYSKQRDGGDRQTDATSLLTAGSRPVTTHTTDGLRLARICEVIVSALKSLGHDRDNTTPGVSMIYD
jgi:hypothetical protein